MTDLELAKINLERARRGLPLLAAVEARKAAAEWEYSARYPDVFLYLTLYYMVPGTRAEEGTLLNPMPVVPQPAPLPLTGEPNYAPFAGDDLKVNAPDGTDTDTDTITPDVMPTPSSDDSSSSSPPDSGSSGTSE